MDYSCLPVLLRHPLTAGVVAPARPSADIGIEIAILYNGGNVAFCLDDHRRSYKRLKICLALLLIPDEVMSVETYVIGHVVEHLVNCREVLCAAVTDYGIHLQGIAGCEHLEILVGKGTVCSAGGSRLVVHGSTKAESNDHIRSVL